MAAANGRSWSDGSEQEMYGQVGLDFCSLLVSNIPDYVTESNLRSHFSRETLTWREDPDVRMMSTQAIVTFKSPSYAMDIARKGNTTYNGTDLTVEPHIEVFSAVTAVIPARLGDYLPNDVINRLENKTGVQVNRNSKQNNTLEITGSFHEIEQAQKMLRQRFATIINEELQTGSLRQVSISSNLSGKHEYTDDQGAAAYSEHTMTSVIHSYDRETTQSYQTNGLGPDLAEHKSKDGSTNGRSRTMTRKTAGRSSSLSRVETSSQRGNRASHWDTKEGPVDIIGERLDNRSSGTSAVKRPHTQPVLSSKSTSVSKSQPSTSRKLKTPSNPILPSKTLVPNASAARSGPTGRSSTVTSSSKSKGRLQGAAGGVGASTSTTRASKRKAHSVHHYRGVKISVVHGDLTEEIVDVIVSSAGGDLRNLGGVAGAISRAGGPSIQVDCDRYRRRHGPLKTTECMVTGPGRLHCDCVIHVAGPVFQSRHPFKTEEELKYTTFKVLTAAAGDQKESIALPAISSGTFRVPKDMCARAMLAGIMAFAETQREIFSGLRDIRIVDSDLATVFGFSSHCEKLLDESSDRDSRRGSRHRSSSMSRAERRDRASSSSHTVSPSNTSNVPTASGATGYGSSYSSDNYQSLPRFHDKTEDHLRNENYWDHQNTPGMESSSQAYPHDRSTKNDDQQDETCPICMSDFTDPKSLPCKHRFCTDCLATALKHAAKCPVCGLVLGQLRGDQPDGRMECVVERNSSLPGYPGCGTIIIHYDIPSGLQGPEHPDPGQRFHGTSRKAYLPYNSEGQEVLALLKEAWKNKLVFTIGTSVSTGTSDAVTWNDIHHKTNRSGGPTRYGYPDPTYLGRVKEELAAKGITPRPSTT